MKDQKEKKTEKNYFDFSEVLNYYFRKKDSSRKKNINIKMMHGINKIAIIMFLFAFLIWVIRRIV